MMQFIGSALMARGMDIAAGLWSVEAGRERRRVSYSGEFCILCILLLVILGSAAAVIASAVSLFGENAGIWTQLLGPSPE